MKLDWRTLVKTVAPTLGAALGGPLGGMAGALVAKAVTGKADATAADAPTALASGELTADQLMALKKADQDFAAQMKQLDVDIFKLETADVQSARAMYSVNFWPQVTITAVYLAGYFGLLFVVVFGKTAAIDPAMMTTAQVLIGVLTAAVPQILGFWFGSSYGSKEKTAALAVSTPTTALAK